MINEISAFWPATKSLECSIVATFSHIPCLATVKRPRKSAELWGVVLDLLAEKVVIS